MRNLILMIGLVALVCFNCDGRKTKKEALENAVSEYNLKYNPSEHVLFYPENPVEIVTDTLFANKIKVHVKNYSLPEAPILISKNKVLGSLKTKYQRAFECEIKISLASKDILTTHISAENFRLKNSDPFWDAATLEHAWVNQEFTSENEIALDIAFINPLNKSYKYYRLAVDLSGNQRMNLIEERG